MLWEYPAEWQRARAVLASVAPAPGGRAAAPAVGLSEPYEWIEFCYHPPGGFIGKREPQSILKTDECSVVLELGHEGKFVTQIKREGDKLEVAVKNGRWLLTHLPASPRPAAELLRCYFPDD